MSWLYRNLLRPALFTHDSEKIHNRTLAALSWAARHPATLGILAPLFRSDDLPVELFDLKFPNPVGLAAGMDKQAAAVPVWSALGFGFCELGGVTRYPQEGNPPPRMFRAVGAQALINRMGFNNPGAEVMAQRLDKLRRSGRWPNHPVGINLGKSKITPLESAAEDYVFSFKLLRGLADFFVVNVSSPNTPNLRQLQDKAALQEIFAALQEANPGPRSKPILVKVAPDLSFSALDEILELTYAGRIAGIVATNTTVTRPDTSDPRLIRMYEETGGLSGRPLAERSTGIIRHIHRQTHGKLPIVGVGGIFDAADAWEKIVAGASLLQIYTGLVYEGPGLPRRIVKGLGARLREAGFSSLSEAVGTAKA